MTEQINLVPKRRFKEFQNTHNWEQRKFDEMFDCSIPNNTLSRAELNYDIGEIKSVHYGDILVKYGAVTDVAKDEIPFITNGDIAKYKSHLLNNGDIILADTAEDETVGKATEIAGISDDCVVSGLHTIVCRPKADMQENYLGYYMNSTAYHRQLLPLMQGVKVLAISRSNLVKTTVSYPVSSEEQRKVGMFFKQLDNLITLHQRKLEKTKALKSAYLSEMFPAEGECEPKRRFTGYTGDWEQRKLGDIYDVVSGFAFKKSDYVQVGAPIINGESIQHGSISTKNLNFLPEKFLNKYQNCILQTGDIVLGLNRPITNGNLKIAQVPKDLHGALLYQRAGKIIILNDSDINFSYQLLGNEVLKFVLKESVGSDQPFISTNKLKEWSIRIPALEEEQKKIGLFFKNLDDTIALHQHKLEKLQNIKKAYLNEMFV